MNTHKARGFTWYSENGGVCVLFDQPSREETQDCLIDCVSFMSNDDLICHQMEGFCAKGNNFLYRWSSDNEFNCFRQCLAFDDCRYYSWVRSSDDSKYRDECQFFSSCDTLIPDNQTPVSVTGYLDLDIGKN